MTVLIGPNNEGKSNILAGLVTGLRLLERFGRSGASRTAPQRLPTYRNVSGFRPPVSLIDLENDFHITSGGREKTPIKFSFEFELNDTEITEFRTEIKSSLNGRLPLDVLVLKDGEVKVEVRKPGRGSASLSKKAKLIARFVGQRVDIKSIPAVRTGRAATNVVQELVEEELSTLESTPEYRTAVESIAKIQRPILNILEAKLLGTLSEFMPTITSVDIRLNDRFTALRRDCEVVVNDGTPTTLARKGDGIQSLAALSLAHYQALARTDAAAGLPLLAIEEPEAHLHPKAVASLLPVLTGIASTQQVVISTHNPILVRREQVESNIVVNRNRARCARSIQEIRDLLGVRVQDNLSSAELILVVEGACDSQILTALLSFQSATLKSSLSNGRMVIVVAHGAPNIANQFALYKGLLCEVHIFADNDSSGREAVEKARGHGLVEREYHLAVEIGRKESELEDLIAPTVYAGAVQDKMGMAYFPSRRFTAARSKWSVRMTNELRNCGKVVDANAVKPLVAECVAANPDGALSPHARGAIDELTEALTARLSPKVRK